MPRYAYSYDREDFKGAFDTPEAALQAAVRNCEGLASPPTTMYIGRLMEVDPQASDHAESIIHAMSQRAHVDMGDAARNYLRKVRSEQAQELDAMLQQTILAWLAKNKLMPTFVRVADVREYPIPMPRSVPPQPSEASEVTEIGTSEGNGEW